MLLPLSIVNFFVRMLPSTKLYSPRLMLYSPYRRVGLFPLGIMICKFPLPCVLMAPPVLGSMTMLSSAVGVISSCISMLNDEFAFLDACCASRCARSTSVSFGDTTNSKFLFSLALDCCGSWNVNSVPASVRARSWMLD